MNHIAVIIHSKDKAATELCLSAVQEENLPDNYDIEAVVLHGNSSRGRVYSEGQRSTRVDYRIFLDENAILTDNNIIAKIIRAFNDDEKIGIVSTSGAKVLLSDGVARSSPKRLGSVYNAIDGIAENWLQPEGDWEECLVADGYFIASRIDIPWRADLFDDEDFLAASACIEAKRLGYKTCIIRQEIPAVAYQGYPRQVSSANRQRFLDEYYKDIYPLVSVIIPQYERVEWFFEALDSVVGQTYRNLDIFITDNSHNTKTAERIRPYLEKDSRITYEHHPEYDLNGNLSRAISYNNAEASLVNWLMNDDLWHPDKIRQMVDCTLANDNIGLVTSVRRLIDAEGNEIKSEVPFAQKPIGKTGIIDGQSAGRRLLQTMTNYIGEPTTVLVRKQCMLDGYRLGFSGNEGKYLISDFPTWLHVLAQADMVYICHPLSSMRIHENQQQKELGVTIIGMICWIMEMEYAWERGQFFTSRQELIQSVINWRRVADGLLDNLASENIFEEDIAELVRWIDKANRIATGLKQCACCSKKFLYYAPLPGYYKDMARQYGDYRPHKAEMLNSREYTCPVCGAADRERAYALWLEKSLPRDKKITVLDIAPAPALGNFIKRVFPLADYKTMDLFMPGVDYRMDIMDMNLLPDMSVDVFICSHVLEHVRDDRKAMGELRRVLKRDGKGILVVPLDLNQKEIDEDPDCTDVGERWRRFGQDDRVRNYSKRGYLERLAEAGFAVEQIAMDYFGEDAELNALSETATVYIVSRAEG